MAKKSFDLGGKLADVLNVSVPDTGAEQIVRLPLSAIDADERNFYSVEGVEALAANIELVGLLDPIRVREDPDAPGRYRIVSGHRRSAALRLLAEEDPEKWSAAPCIVEAPAASPELQELRLIYANADTRRMTSAEISAQAQRVEALLYALKEQGVEFPGRMRDHVAEACKVSATKLAELKVIREKLAPEWMPYYEKNKINHIVAYKIARLSLDMQKKVRKYVKNPEHVREWQINDIAEAIRKAPKKKCRCFDAPCGHAEKMLDVEFLETGPQWCSHYDCCEQCSRFVDCEFVCPSLRDKQAKMRKAKKDARAEKRKKEKARDEILIDRAKTCWSRFGELRKKKGLSIPACFELRGEKHNKWHNDEADEEKENGAGEFTPSTTMPWGHEMKPAEIEKLIKTADAFGCSTDYLLGRTDAKDVHKGEWISVDDRYPEEGTFCLAFTKFGAVIPSVYWRASFMDFTEKSTANKRLERVERWMRLPPPPDGKKYIGQETLEGMVKK